MDQPDHKKFSNVTATRAEAMHAHSQAGPYSTNKYTLKALHITASSCFLVVNIWNQWTVRDVCISQSVELASIQPYYDFASPLEFAFHFIM